MDEIQRLPPAFQSVYQSLEPYIRPRQDVIHIRRVLAVHLQSHVQHTRTTDIFPSQLALPDATFEVESRVGVRGLRKEYLRCLQANINVQRCYANIKNESHFESEKQLPGVDPASSQSESSLEPFLELTKRRRSHNRLRVVQEYVDALLQKPAAGADYVKSQKGLRDSGTLPRLPPEVLTAVGSHQSSEKMDLKALVDQLEKSVLRAQLLLKQEKKLLARVQAQAAGILVNKGNRLRALESTRIELIAWMEKELGKAGDTSAGPDANEDATGVGKRGKDFIDFQLMAIKRQYARYVEIREKLILVLTQALDPPMVADEAAQLHVKGSNVDPQASAPCNQPYLEDLVSISQQQKSILRLKSHITSVMAKQLKESVQGLERLADESHLLHLYPMPSMITQGRSPGPPPSFGDEIGRVQKSLPPHRARAWVYAADSSSSTTKEAILEKLEQGEVALENSHQTLLDFQGLLGIGFGETKQLSAGVQGSDLSGVSGLWAQIDGSMGGIKLED